MRSTAEDQSSYLIQAPPSTVDPMPIVLGGGTIMFSLIAFFLKWGFTQLSNNLKEDITGLKASINELSKAHQQFSIEYVRKAEFDRAILKIETQTESVVSRLEIKLEKLGDKIEQLLIKDR